MLHKPYEIVNNFKYIETIDTIAIKIAEIPKDCLFTIAIPTYKRANLLKQALESSLNQEGNIPYTILVVDNNPDRNDETESFMAEYSSFENISYYKNTENIGQIGNWNRLYQLAKTKYVIMLHDDDLMYPDYILKISDIINKHKGNVPAFLSISSNIFSDDNIFPNRAENSPFVRSIKTKEFIKGNILGAPTGLCVQKDVALAIGGFSEDFYPSADYHFYVLLSHYHNIYYLNNYPLTVYRFSSNVTAKKETMIAIIKMDSSIKGMILSQMSGLKKWYWSSYINQYRYFHINQLQNVFKNKEFNGNEELKKLGYSVNLKDKLIFRIATEQTICHKCIRKIKRLFN